MQEPRRSRERAGRGAGGGLIRGKGKEREQVPHLVVALGLQEGSRVSTGSGARQSLSPASRAAAKSPSATRPRRPRVSRSTTAAAGHEQRSGSSPAQRVLPCRWPRRGPARQTWLLGCGGGRSGWAGRRGGKAEATTGRRVSRGVELSEVVYEVAGAGRTRPERVARGQRRRVEGGRGSVPSRCRRGA